jgi:hypothetical protein
MATSPRNASPSTASAPASEVEQLRAEVEQLRAENEFLAQQRDEAHLRVTELATAARQPANPEPRFALSAGEQADLQTHGVTRSVRTGRQLLAEDFPDHVDQSALSEQALANIAAAKLAAKKQG